MPTLIRLIDCSPIAEETAPFAAPPQQLQQLLRPVEAAPLEHIPKAFSFSSIGTYHGGGIANFQRNNTVMETTSAQAFHYSAWKDKRQHVSNSWNEQQAQVGSRRGEDKKLQTNVTICSNTCSGVGKPYYQDIAKENNISHYFEHGDTNNVKNIIPWQHNNHIYAPVPVQTQNSYQHRQHGMIALRSRTSAAQSSHSDSTRILTSVENPWIVRSPWIDRSGHYCYDNNHLMDTSQSDYVYPACGQRRTDHPVSQSTTAVKPRHTRKAFVPFEGRLRDLREFKKEYGHCHIPTSTRKRDQLKKYYSLGVWCSGVRLAYKKIQKNEEPKLNLTDEQIQLLEDEGFKWSAVRVRRKIK